MLSCKYSSIFKKTYFEEILRTTTPAILLFTASISSYGLVSALNLIDSLQRFFSRLKEFPLGCLVVGSSLIWKKGKLAQMVTHCTTRCHLFLLEVLLVCLLINDRCAWSSLVCLYLNGRYFRIIQNNVNNKIKSLKLLAS